MVVEKEDDVYDYFFFYRSTVIVDDDGINDSIDQCTGAWVNDLF
jgi:hypothetical protein